MSSVTGPVTSGSGIARTASVAVALGAADADGAGVAFGFLHALAPSATQNQNR
jgi:hypothetical protein